MKKAAQKQESSGFDHQTSIRDPQSGEIVGRKDYKLKMKRNLEGGVESVYEQPIGSGNFFHPSGEKIVIKDGKEEKMPINAEGQSESEFNKANGKQEAAADSGKKSGKKAKEQSLEEEGGSDEASAEASK